MNKTIQILQFLQEKDLLKTSPKFWWPSYGNFEVVLGAILTQNTTWINVEKSLKNLQNHLELDSFISLDEDILKEYIKPSGFYNQKAPRLLALANNIKQTYGSFKTFQDNTTRKWLLDQKGVGEETADAILCYGCKKEYFVVDTYTKRLFKKFDIEFKTYKEYQNYIQNGIESNWDSIKEEFENNLNLCYAKFHGMIVEYNKKEKYV